MSPADLPQLDASSRLPDHNPEVIEAQWDRIGEACLVCRRARRSGSASHSTNGISIFVCALYSGYCSGNAAVIFRSSTVALNTK